MSMFETGQVEAMLRAHPLPYGSIQLFKSPDDDTWSAMVSHYDGRTVKPDSIERRDEDPVIALGKVLIEDARRLADVGRRYAAAPKAGPVEPADDLMGLLG